MTTPNRLAFVLDLDPAPFALNEAETAAETDVVRPVQMAVAGQYVSRRYGRFAISEQDIDRMVANFSRSLHPVAPTELSVDYDHQEGKASGWIKRLFKKIRTIGARRVVELWADVAWTKAAAQAIANKEYRFFSPMFDKDFVTPTGEKIGTTLTGGALTNRPFLQGMTAISLSARDADMALPAAAQGAKKMGKMITVKDKDGNDVELDLDTLKDHEDVKKLSAPVAATTPPAGTADKVDPNIAALTAAVKATNETVVKLSETIAQREKQDRKTEAERLIDDAIRTGRMLPVDKPLMLSLAENETGFAQLKVEIAKRKPNSVIKLRQSSAGEGSTTVIGAGEGEGDDDGDDITIENAPEKFEAAIAEKMSKDTKLSYDAAMKAVEAENPALAKKFQLSFRRA